MTTQNKTLAVNEISVIQLIPVTAAYQSPLHRPGSLNLRHLHTYINQPLSTCLGDLSLLPQLFSAISIASTARTVLARAGLRNLCTLKVLHRIVGNQVFGERLDVTARSLNVYFLAA